MTEIIQYVLSGLTVGSIYGLVGIGFTGVYNVTGIVNFAQGDFAMFGAMTGIALWGMGVPVPLAILIAVVLIGSLAGAMERWTIRPIAHNALGAVIVTIGLGVALQGVAVAIWGTDARALPAFSGERPLHILGATIAPQALWVIGSAILLVVLLSLFFQYTYLGKAFVACALNRFAASICGIDARRMSNIAFVLSGLLGAFAGLVVSPITFIQYDTGVPLAIKGFTACIIGGLGSPIGAMIGGVLLGILEALAAGYLSSGFKNAIAFVMLLAVLLLRPTGLLGDLLAKTAK
ncbi:MAG: branched-chain amino acid ABC transporter permease [Hyphomicrobiales bacterium]|nr:branched-chain amino acid ABC transporter permease [Hyphomicrobiales bacterium]